MSRWLVTGASGMLGRDLTDLLASSGDWCVGLGRGDLDITSLAAVRDVLPSHRPDVVVNCAAWTAVDDAEAHEAAALTVNGTSVFGLASVCRDLGIPLVQVSTDYVFDGRASSPYAEGHLPNPQTAYGRTKVIGEQALLSLLPRSGYVVRTAWLYGAHGPSFVRTMLRRARAGETSSVVCDQHGQPTWTVDVASRIRALVSGGAAPGIYHATSSGRTTWYGLARTVYQFAGADPSLVQPVGTGAFLRPAPRPAYSVLGHSAWAAAGIPPIDDWRDSLSRAFPSIKTAEGELTR